MDTPTGKTAIITGGASGINRAVAEVLAEAGIAGLTIADIDSGVVTDMSMAPEVERLRARLTASPSQQQTPHNRPHIQRIPHDHVRELHHPALDTSDVGGA